MRCSGASAFLLLSAALLQETVVVVAQELNDTAAAPEDTEQPFVGFVTSFNLGSVDNTTATDTSTSTTMDMDMMPIVLLDAPPTTDTDTTNMTITTTSTMIDDPVPVFNTYITSMTGPPNTWWNKPIWFRSYRKKFKRRRLKKCLFLNGVAPVNGTTCPVIGTSGWYMCMFGVDQDCDATTGPLPGSLSGYTGANLGSVHPTVNCMCHDSLWHCADWKPCESPSTTIKNPFDDTTTIRSCPDVVPIGSSDICAYTLDCPYGKESCCGQTFDSLECHCSAGETFGCFFTEACMNPSCEIPDLAQQKPPDVSITITSCPDTTPIGSSAICASDLKCPYGKETCCGQTFDSLVCQCSAGETFGCFFTDACLVPPCGTPDLTQQQPPPDVTITITSCPDISPIGSSAICSSDLKCPYGKETCCGQTFDSLMCQCSAGETFGCYFTEACMNPSCGAPDLAQQKPLVKVGNGAFCPTSVPMSGDACPAGLDTTTQCAYGSVCCCGQCFDETTCSCDGSASNLFECSTIAIKCSSTCPVDTLAPPECPVDEPQDGDKCAIPDQTCQYGKSCCCDNCAPKTTCDCDAVTGIYTCRTRSLACMFPCPNIERKCPSLDSWPDQVGQPGADAKAFIETKEPCLTVILVPEGSAVTADFRTDRVRIFVDSNNLVVGIPQIG